MKMEKEGFMSTVLDIFKNSMMIGAAVVAMTVLLGILRHSPGSRYLAVAVLILTVVLSLAVYAKREINKRG